MSDPLSKDYQEAPPADVWELEWLLAQWRREQNRQNRGLWQIVLLTLAVCLSLFICRAMNWSYLTTAGCAFISLVALAPLGIEGAALGCHDTGRLVARLKQALRKVDDPRAVGPLLEVLDASALAGPLPAELAILRTLTRLLSKMDAETVEVALRPHRDRLYSCLQWIKPAENPDFIISVLRLLPALNDGPALICAAWYVLQTGSTHNELAVRDAAGAALTSLLSTVDLGGPAALAGWIDQLPFGDVTLAWGDLLSPLAVVQTLPQIAPADYLALDYRCRRRLYASLINMDLHRLQADYTLAVLGLVQRTGDPEALHVVRQLQMASPRSVRYLARQCLPILETRLERERIGRTLLRGSGLPPEPVETLLRSAGNGTADDPQLLLRSNAEE
jgi:hypothetical protein